MSVKPDQFRHKAQGFGVEVMQLSEENADQVKQWCEGQVIWTEHPIDGGLEVGLNYPGSHGMERLSQGEYLMKVDEGEFKRVAAKLFESVYERI